jgi:Holliday junction DNA helicase RuvA
MIAKIKGTLEYIEDNYAVVDVGGVGYKIFASPHTLGKIAGAKEVELYTHTQVREDIWALYGFANREELKMFELLISVSGVGPKAGLGILAIADPKTIRTAVLNEDSSILTRVSGVGKKTAERVILELQNKVADLPESERKDAMAGNDALDALVVMGYSSGEAREALKMVAKDVTDVGERVKAALRNLGKR